MQFEESNLASIIKAIQFSAHKHRNQRRKDNDQSPYINHPIDVTEMLWSVGQMRDINVLIAAILHDTIEDTQTTQQEIEENFGADVLALVLEVTDDKNLPKQTRKQLQIEHAPHISQRAKQIKLADKTCNIFDISHAPPSGWSFERRKEYLDWSEKVVAGLRGSNIELENYYDNVLKEARALLNQEL